jgi:DNA-binding LacI/PurR family transcriptional regulator
MAAWTDPPLTTVRQPIPDLGRWAVERLVAGLRGSPAAARAEHTVLAPSLVLRDSTRSVARG